MNNYQYYNMTLAANATYNAGVYGNFFAMLTNSSTTPVKVQIGDTPEQDVPAGLSIEFSSPFNGLTIRNTTSGQISITFAVATGRIVDSRLSLIDSSLTVNLAANAIATIAQITTTGAAAVAVTTPAQTKEIMIQNTGSNPAWIGDANISTTRGYKLESGETIVLAASCNWYHIDDNTNHTTLNVVYMKQV